jgi:hypothetical protein
VDLKSTLLRCQRALLLGCVTLCALLHGAHAVRAQQTVGLFRYDAQAFDGYTLLAPMTSRTSYLIDNCGREVHRWTSGYKPGLVTTLLPGGKLLRTCVLNSSHFRVGGAGGRVEILDWDGNVEWYYDYSNAQHRQHHDALMLPNGNVLLLAWEWKSGAEAITAGRAPTLVTDSLWPEHLVEIQPTTPGNGNIVWEWHLWDHLVQEFDSSKSNFGVVADHAGLLDLNYYTSSAGAAGFADFVHCNAVAYDPDRDEIILSAHKNSEFYILDHSTTTAEAASHAGGNRGHGGDFLYRWGNPQVYDRASFTATQTLWWQHDPHRIADGAPGAGHVLIFNNGNGRPGGSYSSVDEMAIPTDSNGNYYLEPNGAYGPVQSTWSYAFDPQGSAYSSFISGAQRLPNGNTLICRGPEGIFLEIDSASSLVWHYVNPIATTGPMNQGDNERNETFRVYRFAPDDAAFQGRTLLPGDRLEGNPLPLPANCAATATPGEVVVDEMHIGPNPFQTVLTLQRPVGGRATVQIYDVHGRLMYVTATCTPEEKINTTEWPAGVYFLRSANVKSSKKMIKY